MSKTVIPFYLQTDSIDSLYGHIFETTEQSRKVAQTKGETKSSERKIGFVLSLLQVLGLETNFRRENAESSDYTIEEIRIFGPQDRLRQIRKELSKQGALYNLNTALSKRRPFGSFVDFRAKSNFAPVLSNPTDTAPSSEDLFSFPSSKNIPEFIKITGSIENYQFTTVCSAKFILSRSWLSMILMTTQQTSLIGFGVITDFDSEKMTISLGCISGTVSTDVRSTLPAEARHKQYDQAFPQAPENRLAREE